MHHYSFTVTISALFGNTGVLPPRREVFVQLMLTGEVPHVAVCGVLWNCLFPAQFPEFWDTDVHAEMDAVSETICGGGGLWVGRRERRTKPLQSETVEVLTDLILFNFIRKKITKETQYPKNSCLSIKLLTDELHHLTFRHHASYI